MRLNDSLRTLFWESKKKSW